MNLSTIVLLCGTVREVREIHTRRPQPLKQCAGDNRRYPLSIHVALGGLGSLAPLAKGRKRVVQSERGRGALPFSRVGGVVSPFSVLAEGARLHGCGAGVAFDWVVIGVPARALRGPATSREATTAYSVPSGLWLLSRLPRGASAQGWRSRRSAQHWAGVVTRGRRLAR